MQLRNSSQMWISWLGSNLIVPHVKTYLVYNLFYGLLDTHYTSKADTNLLRGKKPKTKKGNWGGFEMQTTRETKYEIVKDSKEWTMKYQSSVENLIRLKKKKKNPHQDSWQHLVSLSVWFVLTASAGKKKKKKSKTHKELKHKLCVFWSSFLCFLREKKKKSPISCHTKVIHLIQPSQESSPQQIHHEEISTVISRISVVFVKCR